MRALPQLLLPLVIAAAAGCTSTANFDFIEVHGSFVDGTIVDGHKPATAAVVPSLQPAVGTVLATGAPFMGPEDLAGFRLEWVQTAPATGATFPSDPNGPVIFYVARALNDGGVMNQEASVVNGGAITFTSVGTKITGTLSNLVLSRGGANILIITSGSFQATIP
jgi:hypothetical protein